MAKKSMKVKQARPQKYQTREYNRCKLCGRPQNLQLLYSRVLYFCGLCCFTFIDFLAIVFIFLLQTNF